MGTGKEWVAMGTEFFIVIGVFSLELLACQVSIFCTANNPRSIYQYSNMAPRLSGQKTNIKLKHDVIYVDKLTYCIHYSRHICWSNGGLSCGITANHAKECHMSVSIKDWSHSQIFPLAFTITASISLGENIWYMYSVHIIPSRVLLPRDSAILRI